MVEVEKKPARRGRHAPPHQRHRQQQLRRDFHGRTSPYCRMAAHQSRLHNFSLPSISWGKQRLLRCMKAESFGEEPPSISLGASPTKLSDRPPAVDERGKVQRVHDQAAVAEGERYGEEETDDERLDKFREAMMAEFRKAFDKIPLPPPPQPSVSPPGEPVEEREKCASTAAVSTAVAARPWNLRLRRAACNAPSTTAENVKTRSSPSAPEMNTTVVQIKYSLRSDTTSSKEGRPKFSAGLSKEEIEEDYFAMTGTKPPRRCKKRSRAVQKQLEGIHPGSYLTEVTSDLYKIAEEK